ncbi:MAG TPA: aminotransferase class V-fold PLP-dependent enzyme [Candidatus Paceibacterota bacterium]|nr:aminotransferase class V-fold PLP-dependent enzyme [Candidatus Paceibacterota bacterium]
MINGATTYTRLGGSLMLPEVIEAMNRGAESFVDMQSLHAAAGRRLAEITRNEAAYITPGCASAIVLSILAVGRLSDSPTRTDVLIDKSHRIPYDQAITFAGAKIKEYGTSGKRTEEDLEKAINENTLAIFWVAGSYVGADALDIISTVKIAKKYKIPVIVDAAAQLPPVSNLWFFTADAGADVVLFSGGKALRGPQASGLMMGKSKILDVAASLAAPNQEIARAFKVGKEEIFGLLQAVEMYIAHDHEEDFKGWLRDCQAINSGLQKIPGVAGTTENVNQAGQPVPRVKISFDPSQPTDVAQRVYTSLVNENPSIVLDLSESLYISPDMLSEGEIDLVLAGIERAVNSLS